MKHAFCSLALGFLFTVTLAAESLLLPGMDPSIDPRKDFYHYANGAWLKATEIPEDKTSWGSFGELAQQNWLKIQSILENAKASQVGADTVERKVGDFYASGMDTAQIENIGVAPLKPYLKEIEVITNRSQVADEIARLQQVYMDPGFDFSVEVDEKNSDRMTFYLSQGGLGLPTRDYYSLKMFDPIRKAYLKHIANMFILLGDSSDQAERNAQTVFQMEASLAKASKSQSELRDPTTNYHELDLKVVRARAPHFPWDSYFQKMGLGQDPHGVLAQPEFLTAFDQLYAHRSVEDWKTYFRGNLIRDLSPDLGTAFEQEHFNFYLATLSGAKQMEPRWQRVARKIDGKFGEGLGQLYVAKYFPPAAKERATSMINQILAVYHDRLQNAEWMSPATRAKALEKFAAQRVKVGYPDKWIDYSNLQIDRGPYVLNVLRANAFDFDRKLHQLQKPVDKGEWHMTPPTVNAYNNPTGNEIVFPAGILQPPFFDAAADDAVNYGGMGAVIAHEITHSYDDQGRKFDSKGNLSDWWTASDAKKFRERSQKLVVQFSNYEALPGLKVNGLQCLGEEIADLGGVSVAFEALQRSRTGQPAPPLVEGLTPEQRFFLAWARVWRAKYRDAALRKLVTVDFHPPAPFRAVGAPSNVPEFFSAFSIREGDPMWFPVKNRAKIW